MMQMADAGGSRSCERLKHYGIENDYRSQSFAKDVLMIEVGVSRFNKYGCDICFQITNSALDRVVCNAKQGVVFFDFDKHKIAAVPLAFKSLVGESDD